MTQIFPTFPPVRPDSMVSPLTKGATAQAREILRENVVSRSLSLNPIL